MSHARRRKRVVGEGPDGGDINAAAPDDVWALDFQAGQASEGRPIRLVNIIDERTREALVMHAARSIDADEVVARLDALVARRGRAPRFVRMDNGPELTSHALRDWCRFSAAGSVFIEPGCPWQNPFVESFHSRVKTSFSTASSSRASPKPGCSSTTGARTTTSAAPIRRLGCARRPRSPPTKPASRPLPRDARGRVAHRSARPRARLATGDPSDQAPSVAPATTTRLSQSVDRRTGSLHKRGCARAGSRRRGGAARRLPQRAARPSGPRVSRAARVAAHRIPQWGMRCA